MVVAALVWMGKAIWRGGGVVIGSFGKGIIGCGRGICAVRESVE